MLSEILLLVFDVSLYYTVFGFWLRLISGNAPAYAGFALIVLMIAVHALLAKRSGSGRKTVFLLLAIPAAGAAFLAPLQLAFMIPACGYLIYCFYMGKTGIDLPNFREHFRIGSRILLAVLPGVIAGSKGLACLADVVPYLVVMLAAGVVELRNLRDDGAHAGLHGACVLGTIAASGALTAAHAPRLLGSAFLLVYHKLIAPVLYGLAVGGAYLLYWVFNVFRQLGELMGIEFVTSEPGDNEIVTGGENVIEIPEDFKQSNILEYVGRVVLAVLIIAALVFVFRRLMFRLRYEEKSGGSAILSRSRVDAGALSGGAGGRLFRPRDPRLAVRFYYARFLREAAKRGVGVDPDLTGSEIGRRSKAVFPEGLPEMYDIYAPARYSGRDITEADVRGMRSAWKNVKQNGEE